jgi:hypothetical protein
MASFGKKGKAMEASMHPSVKCLVLVLGSTMVASYGYAMDSVGRRELGSAAKSSVTEDAITVSARSDSTARSLAGGTAGPRTDPSLLNACPEQQSTETTYAVRCIIGGPSIKQFRAVGSHTADGTL